jgi:hypothetical protein
VSNIDSSRQPVPFPWRPAPDNLCCGSYHPVSLQKTTLLTITLFLILVVVML